MELSCARFMQEKSACYGGRSTASCQCPASFCLCSRRWAGLCSCIYMCMCISTLNGAHGSIQLKTTASKLLGIVVDVKMTSLRTRSGEPKYEAPAHHWSDREATDHWARELQIILLAVSLIQTFYESIHYSVHCLPESGEASMNSNVSTKQLVVHPRVQIPLVKFRSCNIILVSYLGHFLLVLCGLHSGMCVNDGTFGAPVRTGGKTGPHTKTPSAVSEQQIGLCMRESGCFVWGMLHARLSVECCKCLCLKEKAAV